MIQYVAKNTLRYGVSSILGRMLNYALVPLYTSILLPHEYGIITEWYAYIAFLLLLYTFGMETTYFRFTAKHIHNKKKYQLLAFNIIFWWGVLLSTALLLWANPLVKLLGYPHKAFYIYTTVGIVFTDALLVIPFAALRLQQQTVLFVKKKMLFILLNLFFNFLFLFILPYIGMPAGYDICFFILFANFLSNFLLLLSFYRFWQHVKWHFHWLKVWSMLHYAWPIFLTSLASTTNEMFSRAMLKYLLPDNHSIYTKTTLLGIFGGCYKFSIFMLLGIQAFRYAAEPLFFAHAQDKKSPLLFSKVMHAFILTASLVLLGVSIHLKFLGQLFLRNPIYHEGLAIVPYLLLAYLFYGIYYNLSVWFKITDNTIYGLYFMGIGALVTIVLNLLLIPLYGYWGSVWSILASYVLMMGTCYWVGKKYFPIPYQIKRGSMYLLSIMFVVMLYPLLSFPYMVIQLIFNFSIVFIYLYLIYTFEYKKLFAK